MKRAIRIIVSMIMVCCVLFAANAEDITLHSGVNFGMTIDEVLAQEKNSGYELEKIEKDYGSSKLSTIYELTGATVAGIDLSDINYLFDSDGNLYAATYVLGSIFSDLEPNYSIIEGALVEKYGEPDETWAPILKRMDFEPFDYLTHAGLTPVNKDALPENSAWLIE